MNGCKLMTTCICFSLPPSPRLWLGWAPRCLKEEPSGGVFVPLTPRSGGALLQRCADSPALPAALHRPQPSNVRDTKPGLWGLWLGPLVPHSAGGRSLSLWQERGDRPIGGDWCLPGIGQFLSCLSQLFFSGLVFLPCHVKNVCVCGGSLLPLRNPHPNFQPVQQVRETPSEK